MEQNPRVVAAQIATFHQELIDKGIPQSTALELTYRYAQHIFDVAAVTAQHALQATTPDQGR